MADDDLSRAPDRGRSRYPDLGYGTLGLDSSSRSVSMTPENSAMRGRSLPRGNAATRSFSLTRNSNILNSSDFVLDDLMNHDSGGVDRSMSKNDRDLLFTSHRSKLEALLSGVPSEMSEAPVLADVPEVEDVTSETPKKGTPQTSEITKKSETNSKPLSPVSGANSSLAVSGRAVTSPTVKGGVKINPPKRFAESGAPSSVKASGAPEKAGAVSTDVSDTEDLAMSRNAISREPDMSAGADRARSPGAGPGMGPQSRSKRESSNNSVRRMPSLSQRLTRMSSSTASLSGSTVPQTVPVSGDKEAATTSSDAAGQDAFKRKMSVIKARLLRGTK
mmetsp:Transcript_10398/g.18742  ORF Transcript_10398/g.18742 Transcript_10398/m.18742 type:complete len:333 (+) Transcript_10398:391-1389(+)